MEVNTKEIKDKTYKISSIFENGLNDLKNVSEVGFLSKDFFLETLRLLV